MTGPAPAPCKDCRGDCLKTVDFLAGMPPDKMRELLRHSVRLKLPKGAYIFHAGDPCDAIYIVHKGRVKLCVYDADGQERIAGVFVERDAMWEGVLVPDYTDDPQMLRRTRAFLDTLTNVERVEVLPYHSMGLYK